jgi:uncharacterized protein (TIGR03067 family)
MRCGMWAALAVALGLGGVAWVDDDEAVKAERERFQGTWQLVHAETDGEAAPADRVAKTRVTIEGGTHTVRLGGDVVVHQVPFEIDPTTSPKSVVDTLPDGRTIRGIYQLDGDILISCTGAIDGERPAEFTTKRGSGRTLRIFRRVGSADKDRAIADEYERFVGVWVFDAIQMGGEDLPKSLLEGSLLAIEPAGRFTMTDPQATYKGVYLVDPTAAPKTVDVIFTEGPEAGKVARGIYTLQGDTYTVSMDVTGSKRPTELASPAGSKHIFEVLKRKPKE